MVLIRLGDHGNIVGRIQQNLLESGSPIDAVELKDQKFGHSTLLAVISFQAHHVGSDGHALVSDGVVGPETFYALSNPGYTNNSYIAPGWRCEPAQARPDIVPVLHWAVSKIGTTEEPPGSNRGPDIDKWTGMAGAGNGPPWCAYFCSAAYKYCTSGSPFGVTPIASAYKFQIWGTKIDRLVSDTDAVQLGDIFVILRGDLHGHVGLIAADLGGGKVGSVEGNSGQAVRGLVRPRSSFSCIVRPLV